MRQSRPYTYLRTVQGMCRNCRQLAPCRVFEQDGAVYQESLCHCSPQRPARIADSLQWYQQMMRTTVRCRPPLTPGGPVRSGCPHDCGPCQSHANACHLPVFSVTNVCNMDCPICFTYNRPDRSYFMPLDELRQMMDRVVELAAPLDLVNVTGGEPTLHPDIPALLAECRRPEVGRVTMNSNGLRLAEDEDLCRTLADMGIYVILSLHTLLPEVSHLIHGRDVVESKLRALENLQRHGVGVTLLNVMIRGINDCEIGDILQVALQHPNVRSVTVQTMAFTGQGGGHFGPRNHMPLDGAAAAIERATGGQLQQDHFGPHASAHPLCYSVAYYLRQSGQLRSLSDLLSDEQMRDMLSGSYLLRPDDRFQEQFRVAIDRAWTHGRDEQLLLQFKQLIGQLYPPGKPLTDFQRQRIAEDSILTVYLHSHMDEDTLDTARLAVCPDQVPDAQGRLIPACAYNLFYRQKDPRFWTQAKEGQVS